MDRRARPRLLFFIVLLALTALGCGVTAQPNRFQTSFLPAAASPASAGIPELPPAPEAKPNLYLRSMPAYFIDNPPLPPKKTRGDALILQANERFQRGKRFYQSKDVVNSRREFDAAIDTMLEASDHSPADRLDYEHQFEEMADAIHRYDLAALGASAGVTGGFEKVPLEDILTMTFPVDPRQKDRVREQVSATVSQLPLSVNDTVLGYINYFSNRGRATIIAGIRRSGRYRPMIQRILDEEGLPPEFIHLAQAESGFIPRAISRKAAGGMWQFVKFRGNEYGLTQTRDTDERMDPEKATRAAARHLRDLYTQFGDWYLAVAAYNCGPGTVEKAVERTGYADFWELRRRGVLPAETTNYVPIILAMTIMQKNAAAYGLENIQPDPPLEYDTIEMPSNTSMALVADITETSPAELAVLNPAVLKTRVPEKFALHVPKGTGTQLVAALGAVPAEHRDSWRMHRVGAGETLAGIAKRYGSNPNGIVSANNLASAEAMEGDRLLIPVAERAEAPAQRTVSRAATRKAGGAGRTTAARKPAGAKPASVSSLKPKTRVMVARTNAR